MKKIITFYLTKEVRGKGYFYVVEVNTGKSARLITLGIDDRNTKEDVVQSIQESITTMLNEAGLILFHNETKCEKQIKVVFNNEYKCEGIAQFGEGSKKRAVFDKIKYLTFEVPFTTEEMSMIYEAIKECQNEFYALVQKNLETRVS